MEVRFENSYVRNKALTQEILRYHCFYRPIMVVLHLLLLVGFAVQLVLSILEQTYNLAVLAIPPLYFALVIYRYFRAVSLTMKRDQEVLGGEMTVHTVVTDDRIEITASNGVSNSMEFGSIQRVVQTKNLILLRTKAKLNFIFDKNRFEVGTAEEFLAFVRSKGIR